MTDRELMQQALEALEKHAELGLLAGATITAIREALAQPEQEPVAHCDRCGKKLGGDGHIHTCNPQVQDPMPLFDDWNKDWQK